MTGRTIEFLGVWKDTSDRAMPPIQVDSDGSNKGQNEEYFNKFVNKLKAEGKNSGLIAF